MRFYTLSADFSHSRQAKNSQERSFKAGLRHFASLGSAWTYDRRNDWAVHPKLQGEESLTNASELRTLW